MTYHQTHQSPETPPPGAAADPAATTSRRALARGGDRVRDPREVAGTEKPAGPHQAAPVQLRVPRRSHHRSLRPTAPSLGRLEYILLGLIALGITITLVMAIVDPAG
jgi:hypothetical protein